MLVIQNMIGSSVRNIEPVKIYKLFESAFLEERFSLLYFALKIYQAKLLN